MTRVGIVGLGFMGKMHGQWYQALEDVEIAAVCDIDATKFEAKAGGGNIESEGKALDLARAAKFTELDELLRDATLDAISITLPTYLHAENTVKALEAGLHVLCEKPMALTVDDCRRMIDAAQANDRILQIGQCIRFWPEYAATVELVRSGKYGKVMAATFQRLSLTPTWSWQDWLMDGSRSGGATVDLHIHDSDFVQYLFGMPTAVYSRAALGPSMDLDHIVTQYIYEDGPSITAEGSWIMTPGFGFEMSFNIAMEEASIVFDCTRDPAFRVCPKGGEPFTPDLAAGDGWSREIEHFVRAVRGEQVPPIISPEDAMASLRLVLAEKDSARSGQAVSL